MTVFPFKNMKSVLPLVTKSRVTIGNIITDKISFSFIKSVKTKEKNNQIKKTFTPGCDDVERSSL